MSLGLARPLLEGFQRRFETMVDERAFAESLTEAAAEVVVEVFRDSSDAECLIQSAGGGPPRRLAPDTSVPVNVMNANVLQCQSLDARIGKALGLEPTQPLFQRTPWGCTSTYGFPRYSVDLGLVVAAAFHLGVAIKIDPRAGAGGDTAVKAFVPGCTPSLVWLVPPGAEGPEPNLAFAIAKVIVRTLPRLTDARSTDA